MTNSFSFFVLFWIICVATGIGTFIWLHYHRQDDIDRLVARLNKLKSAIARGNVTEEQFTAWLDDVSRRRKEEWIPGERKGLLIQRGELREYTPPVESSALFLQIGKLERAMTACGWSKTTTSTFRAKFPLITAADIALLKP